MLSIIERISTLGKTSAFDADIDWEWDADRCCRGVSCSPNAEYLYRLNSPRVCESRSQSLVPRIFRPAGANMNFDDTTGRFTESSTQFAGLSQYYEDGNLWHSRQASFWTDSQDQIEFALQNHWNFAQATMALGMSTVYDETLVLRIPRDKYLERDPRIPWEGDAVAFREFFPQKIQRGCNSGLTLNLNDLPFATGKPEYILHNVRVEDVEFYVRQYPTLEIETTNLEIANRRGKPLPSHFLWDQLDLLENLVVAMRSADPMLATVSL